MQEGVAVIVQLLVAPGASTAKELKRQRPVLGGSDVSRLHLSARDRERDSLQRGETEIFIFSQGSGQCCGCDN